MTSKTVVKKLTPKRSPGRPKKTVSELPVVIPDTSVLKLQASMRAFTDEIEKKRAQLRDTVMTIEAEIEELNEIKDTVKSVLDDLNFLLDKLSVF